MKSTWLTDDIELPKFEPLGADRDAEVAIIGGGLCGTLAAYLLAKEGKKVVVLDKGETIADSTTAYTTAFLSSDVDTDLSDLKSMFGKRVAYDVWRSGSEAIDSIEDIVQKENIDCKFMRVPEFWYATSIHGFNLLDEEAKEGRAAGFSITYADKHHARFKNFGVFTLENQAKFHPIQFLSALQKKTRELGAAFYFKTEALEVNGKGPFTIKTDHGTITAEHVIVATYLPLVNSSRIFGKKGIYYSYIYELSIPKGTFDEGTYIDDQIPYHYFRIDRGSGENGADRMIIGGEDHRKELPVEEERQFRAIRNYLEDYFPALTYSVIRSWRGPILETYDGLPYIGRMDKERPKLLVATGFSGNGMTYSMTAAKILSDIVLGKKNKYEDIFSPYRPTTGKAIWFKGRDYLEELVSGYFGNLIN
jgi:glycine/D-amino acid oxidase-like deaminating enzyme